MKNKNLLAAYWLLQVSIILAFVMYYFASGKVNGISEVAEAGNLSVWKSIFQISQVIWVAGWLILVIGSLLGISLDWYDFNSSKAKYIGLSFFFAPLVILIAALIFQPW